MQKYVRQWIIFWEVESCLITVCSLMLEVATPLVHYSMTTPTPVSLYTITAELTRQLSVMLIGPLFYIEYRRNLQLADIQPENSGQYFRPRVIFTEEHLLDKGNYRPFRPRRYRPLDTCKYIEERPKINHSQVRHCTCSLALDPGQHPLPWIQASLLDNF